MAVCEWSQFLLVILQMFLSDIPVYVLQFANLHWFSLSNRLRLVFFGQLHYSTSVLTVIQRSSVIVTIDSVSNCTLEFYYRFEFAYPNWCLISVSSFSSCSVRVWLLIHLLRLKRVSAVIFFVYGFLQYSRSVCSISVGFVFIQSEILPGQLQLSF